MGIMVQILDDGYPMEERFFSMSYHVIPLGVMDLGSSLMFITYSISRGFEGESDTDTALIFVSLAR